MRNYYLKEFQYWNGEYDITFNIVDIDTSKMTITLNMATNTTKSKLTTLKKLTIKGEKYEVNITKH